MQQGLLLMLAIALLLGASCSAPGRVPPEDNRLAEGFLPTPYSAEEIRAQCSPSRKVVLEMKAQDQPTIHQVFWFTTNEAGEATLDAWVEDAERKRIGDVSTGPVDWTELQGHASYPEESCQVAVNDVSTALGTLRCWTYTVLGAPEGKEVVDVFCFAQDLAGPPVLFTREVNGATIFRMEMIESSAE